MRLVSALHYRDYFKSRKTRENNNNTIWRLQVWPDFIYMLTTVLFDFEITAREQSED